jgi:uncharacterized protein
MDEQMIDRLTGEFSHNRRQIENTLQLLEEGCTIPFISRYRKEKTGELDEVQIQAIRDRYEYMRELEARKVAVLESIETQGKLTEDLRKQIRACTVKQELEDLYLPYRPKRRTRATVAKEKGLEPLAQIIKEYIESEADLDVICAPFIDPEREVNSAEEALQGAKDILAEEASEDPEFRASIRNAYESDGEVVSRVKKKHEGIQSKFDMYYDYREKLRDIPSHHFLAMKRGESEGILTVGIEGPDDTILHQQATSWVQHPDSYFAPLMKEALEDGYDRLARPSIAGELMQAGKGAADDESIVVFEKNLRNLLLQPPGGQKTAMGIDPGYRTGCKVAVVDRTGRFCEKTTIYPTEPFNRVDEAESNLLSLIGKYHIEVIAIGNGTASRETHSFVKGMLQRRKSRKDIRVYVVNESGASVYSASELARQEFPDLDVTVRGAISIARRFQDPLAELVKIDPKSIGVGQYQHDVDQKKLKFKLSEVVEFVVNQVGVEINSASGSLLEYVSGITPSLAKHIVEYRFKNGAFRSRDEFRNVPRFGDKAFEQAAGFLRIHGAAHPLDSSAVHPESYPIVERMASDLGVSIGELVENESLIERIDLERYCTGEVGLPTLRDIVEELKKPGRDPREEVTSFEFSEEINDISDLEVGMLLDGIVTNVTNFGAFVDVGVHQDGLVHISQMSKRFVKNPYEVCSVGQKVRVKVLNIDTERKRISLSMKDL